MIHIACPIYKICSLPIFWWTCGPNLQEDGERTPELKTIRAVPRVDYMCKWNPDDSSSSQKLLQTPLFCFSLAPKHCEKAPDILGSNVRLATPVSVPAGNTKTSVCLELIEHLRSAQQTETPTRRTTSPILLGCERKAYRAGDSESRQLLAVNANLLHVFNAAEWPPHTHTVPHWLYQSHHQSNMIKQRNQLDRSEMIQKIWLVFINV